MSVYRRPTRRQLFQPNLMDVAGAAARAAARAAGRAAGNYARDYVHNVPQRQARDRYEVIAARRSGPISNPTPGGGRMALKRHGASSSRSAGIVGKLRKVYKSKRKPKKVTVSGFIKGGVEKTIESYKQESTTKQCLTFMHGTHPRSQILDLAWKSIIRLAILKTKCGIDDWNALVQPFNAVNWFLSVQYVQNGLQFSAAYPFAATTKWSDVISWLTDISSRPWYSNSTVVDMDRLIIQNTTLLSPFFNYNLRNCKVQYSIKSTLKMQNRSVNTVGQTEADDIDNVPLYGKIYEGSGTGLLRPKIATDAQLEISQTTGYLVAPDSGNYREPLDAKYYDKVKYSSKLKIEPGEIKTSSLSSVGSMFITSLCRKCGDIIANSNPRLSMGKFRMVALEKMIDTLVDDAATGIVVGLEHNVRYRFKCTSFDNIKLVPEFSRLAM